jgi:hypothetical protein
MASLQDLGQAIARHPNPVKMIFLGFDLWLEVLGSGKVKTALFKKGGLPTTEEEPIKAAKIPLMAVGEAMVIAVDITLPPDGFRLAP